MSVLNRINLSCPGNFFKYLTETYTDYLFSLPFTTHDLSHWMLVLDTDLHAKHKAYDIMHDKKLGVLTNPAGMTSYVLSSDNFVQRPALARAVFFDYTQACFIYARALKVAPESASIALIQYAHKEADIVSRKLFRASQLYFRNVYKVQSTFTNVAERAGILYREKPKPRTIYDKGVEKFKRDKFEKALQYFNDALILYQADNDHATKEKATVLYGMGSIYKKLQQWPQAAAKYHKSYNLRLQCLSPEDKTIEKTYAAFKETRTKAMLG